MLFKIPLNDFELFLCPKQTYPCLNYNYPNWFCILVQSIDIDTSLKCRIFN